MSNDHAHGLRIVIILAMGGGCSNPTERVGQSGQWSLHDGGEDGDASREITDSGIGTDTPTRIPTRTRADRMRFLAAAASRRGDTQEAIRLATQAEHLTLTPRVRDERRTRDFRCEELSGPNLVRFKFVEGSRVRYRGGAFIADQGSSLRREGLRELDLLNSLSGLHVQRTFTQTDETLQRLKVDGERESGHELADLTLWFDAVRGDYTDAVADASQPCANLADLLNTLNRLSVIEIVHPVGRANLGQRIPHSPGRTDWFPTTPTWEPHYMRSSAGGMNTPVSLTGLEPFYDSSWQGYDIAVISMENALPNAQEVLGSVTAVLDDWAAPSNVNSDAWHSTMTLNLAVGAQNDLATGQRFGLRGQAPLARRGFTPSGKYWGWPGSDWIVLGTADGLLRASNRLDRGDIITSSVGITVSGNVVGATGYIWAPIDYDAATRQASDVVAANGRIIFELSGNDGLNIDPLFAGVTRSRSFIVGATDARTTPVRAWFSNFGAVVELSAPGVVEGATDSPPPLPPPPPGSAFLAGSPLQQGQQYSQWHTGTSFSTPLLAGASARLLGLFKNTYQHVLGDPGFGTYDTLRRTLLEISSVMIPGIGTTPDFAELAMERVMVARIDPCDNTLQPRAVDRVVRPPHDADTAIVVGSGVALDTSGTLIPTIPGATVTPTCLWRWPWGVNNAVSVFEEEFGATNGALDLGSHGTARGFTLESRVAFIAPTSQWQVILAKENPRNYGLWITPYGAAAPAGTLHFSYQPMFSQTLCPVYSNRIVADGNAHHVAVVFDHYGTLVPVIRFYVDGVLDSTSFGCGSDPPATAGGAGSNSLVVGGSVALETRIGDVRLYHYPVSAGRILDHARGVR